MEYLVENMASRECKSVKSLNVLILWLCTSYRVQLVTVIATCLRHLVAHTAATCRD